MLSARSGPPSPQVTTAGPASQSGDKAWTGASCTLLAMMLRPRAVSAKTELLPPPPRV